MILQSHCDVLQSVKLQLTESLLYNDVLSDECMHNNGGCEHVCLPTLDSFRCACRFGRFLDKDEKSCVSSGK